MSAVESKPVGGGGALERQAQPPEAGPVSPALEGEPFLESDEAETALPYDHGKLPWWVTLVWMSLFVGLGLYTANLYIPDLFRWGAP